jgi:hypothetical protein
MTTMNQDNRSAVCCNHLPDETGNNLRPGDRSQPFVWLIVFGVSMGYFEAAVVADLRALFHPDGNLFPLTAGANRLGLIELGREFFSLLMLVAVSALAGRGWPQRLGYFLMLFAVWDVFYYVFLKVLLDWPASLLTWDLLFLLPVPWVAPVAAPVVAAATMFVMGCLLARMGDDGVRVRWIGWWGLGAAVATLVLVVSFCWDWRHIQAGGLPCDFSWGIFAAGELLLIAVFAGFHRSRHKAR